MSYYSDQLTTKAGAVISGHITVAPLTSVPETSDVKLEKNQGYEVDATYVYADLAGSSVLAQRAFKPVTAKIIRSYINGAADILRHFGGEIRSFDGDRVMAIFMGSDKETMAVRSALGVNWLVENVLAPSVASQWSDLDFWEFKHSVGIDTGEALITRGGVRGDSDLISIGPAPNIAAKLSDLRDGRSLHITSEVYERMSDEVAFASTPSAYPGGRPYRQPMWTKLTATRVGNKSFQPLGSNYWWEP